MTAIANSASSCMRSFSQLVAALATGEQEHRESMPPEKIENEHGRFKIWCGNLGVLQSGQSSLDFRLGESSVIQATAVMGLVIELDQTLKKSIQVANGSRPPLEKLPIPEYSSDDSSEDESESEDEDGIIATELSQRMLTVVDINAALYKLSFMIQNAVTRAKFLKPTLYEEVDQETGVDKFGEYAKYDHDHVLESFNQLRKDAAKRMSKIFSESSEEEPEGTYLVERLAITITKRRRALCYWEKHAKELFALDVLKGSNEAVLALPRSSSVPIGATPHLNADQLLQQPQPVVNFTTPNVMEQSILSGNEADDSHDPQSVISSASTASDVDGNIVDLPPAPVAALRGSEFICNYCGIVCPSRHGKNKAWRFHVLQDLQPYICTYPECSDAFQMHSSRRLWLEHEQLVHRRIWQCFDHVNAVFASPAELRDHLHSEHSFTKAQIETLLDFCESSVKDMRTKCPICLEEGPFETGLDNHLSSHMERFAIFSVPRGIFSGDKSESRADGNSEKVQGLRSDILTESISLSFQSPPASACSHANKEPEDETRLKKVVSMSSGSGSLALSNVGSRPDLTLINDSDLAGRQNSLGDRPEDTEEIIREFQLAVEVKPEGHSDFANSLGGLRNRLGPRYQRTESIRSMEEAIRVVPRVAVKPKGHPDLASYLRNLSNRLGDRSTLTRIIHELEMVIRAAQHALEVTLEVHPDHARYLADRGKSDETEKRYQDTIKEFKKALGAEHTSTLGIFSSLGNLYSRQGMIVKAEEMYGRALQGYERALGLEHTSTLDTVNKLGLLYSDQGKLEEAEAMYRRALQAYEKASGPDHTLKIDTLRKLSMVYRNQGKQMEATLMTERVWRGYEELLEPYRPLRSSIFRGLLYSKKGNLEKAEAMFLEALSVMKPHHTLAPDISKNLGILYRNQGRLEEAEAMFLRALHVYEKAWGVNHISTLEALNYLGLLYSDQGKPKYVPAGAARIREGMGTGSHIDAQYGPQSRPIV